MKKENTKNEVKYWLVKSEPSVYSIDHLKNDKKTSWEGVRNFQARNFMRDSMQKGDLVFFYHSNCEVPGIYGVAKVTSLPHPDMTQFVKDGEYFANKSTMEKPIWFCVDISYVKKFKNPISLSDLKKNSELKNMTLLQKGSRLSVQPVKKSEWEIILKISQ